MRAPLELFARRVWSGEAGRPGAVLATVALPASWLWRGATWLGARRRPARPEGVRVVSVGNLAVGGTGKTPLTGWIGGELAALGARPAILVGGLAADEAALHRSRRPTIPVHEGSDRLAAARAARGQGARTLVLDDGFQHRRLDRDLDVVVLAAEDAFPGAVLPRGPYREPASALGRAHVVVVTRRTADRGAAHAVAMRAGAFAPDALVCGLHLRLAGWGLLGGEETGPPRGSVLAVCAIGRADVFQRCLARTLQHVDLLAFPDHRRFGSADLERIEREADGRPIVVTEKDAIKLEDVVRDSSAVVVARESLEWDWGEAELRARLAALAGTVVA